MRNILVGFILLIINPTFANNQEIAKILYPNSSYEQGFVANFFKIVESHRKQDPFFEGKGPSMNGFSLDQTKFAFIVNPRANNSDLVIFNWDKEVINDFKVEQNLSKLYKSTVYRINNIPNIKIATQGENFDQLTNFSYIYGANHISAPLLREDPNIIHVDEIMNWKPHPRYMDARSPMRKSLGTETLVLLSPSKKLYASPPNTPDDVIKNIQEHIEKRGGHEKLFLNMMIHESFHTVEGDHHALGTATERASLIDGNRANLVESLTNDSRLRNLYEVYTKIIFSLSDDIEKKINNLKLSQLAYIISILKKEYPVAWNFIWEFEYTEGIAEYASSYSLVYTGVVTLSAEIELQKNGKDNNFAYRTGALGGQYLAQRHKSMSFPNSEDKVKSIWELVLAKENAYLSNRMSLYELIVIYDGYDFNFDGEIEKVIAYLKGTSFEIED